MSRSSSGRWLAALVFALLPVVTFAQTPPPEPPFPPENISNAGNLFCGGVTYIPGRPHGPPEWAAVQSFKGDYVVTPVFGVIVSAFYADIDNAFTHEFHFGDCKGFPNILAAFAPDCPSAFRVP